MRKALLFLLISALVLTAGCGAKQTESTQPPIPETTVPVTEEPTEAPTEEPTEAPTEPAPVCSDATVLVGDAPAVLMLLNRGDTVDIVGEYDEDHFVIKTESGYGLVEKQLLRMSDEAAYETWTGYAYGNAEMYSHYQLIGEPVRTLTLNTQIEVQEELKYCYLVKLEDTLGYITKNQVSRNRIQYQGGNSGGADGGDISLQFGGIVNLSIVPQSGEVTGTAEVLADGTQVILGYFQREETVPVVTEEGFAPVWEGYHTLYLDGFYAYTPKNLLTLEGEEAYAQWSGFAGYNAELYDNYLLQGDCEKLYVNTAVTVLFDGGDFYIVSVNEEIGYMAVKAVGKTRYSTGGGGGGGGDWTPPAM